MDQYGNTVDKEVWIDKVVTYSSKDGSQKPTQLAAGTDGKSFTEYAIAHADGRVGEERYGSEGWARKDLTSIRSQLMDLGIPEEYWPILMERTVEIAAGSWKPLNV